MRIMVLDVPTTTGGGLTILTQFYQRAVEDMENQWFFVVGRPGAQMPDTSNIRVFRFPEAKKNWGSRLYFDLVTAPKFAKAHNIDKVISLQGSYLRGVECEQVLYLQQALYFCDFPCSLTMEPRIWIYKNILARMRAKDVKKADKLIVQIESTKKACAKRYGVPAEKFIVETPQCSVKFTKTYEKQEKNSFFYPAGAYLFKNVDVLIEAARLLKAQGISNYEIILTLTGKESKVSAMWEQACRSEDLPVHFVGYVDFEKMGDYYAGSVLLFPSFVESFGLPLLEAKTCGSPVIAADLGYAHDVLGDYPNASYFDPRDAGALVELMKKYIDSDAAARG